MDDGKRKIYSETYKRWYRNTKRKGLCVNCGGPAKEARTRCHECLVINAKRTQAYRDRKRDEALATVLDAMHDIALGGLDGCE
jgi:hypothetical protein